MGLSGLSALAVQPFGAACEYLLDASFYAADQSFSDAQVLDTAAEGVPVGSLTVEATTGTIEIVSNELKLTSVDALHWSDLGLSDEDAVTKAIGPALFCSLQRPNLQKSLLSWHDGPLLPTAENLTEYSVRLASGGTLKAYTDTGWGDNAIIAANLAASTWYRFALVLGGYDSNGVPWYDGAAGTYSYGCSVYILGGVFTTWTKLWSFPGGVNNVYAQIQHYEAAGVISLFKNLRTLDRDYSAVLQPTCFSTFDAANGTSLDAITPQVGDAWTDQLGSYDIQGNRAECITISAGFRGVATVDAGISDAFIDVTVLRETVDNNLIGLALRYTAESDLWVLVADLGANQIILYERTSSVSTSRASAAVGLVADTDYNLRAICDGQTIDGFLNGANKITYGAAANNETVTVHGIYSGVAGNVAQFDNFAIYPRTSAVYDSELDAC